MSAIVEALTGVKKPKATEQEASSQLDQLAHDMATLTQQMARVASNQINNVLLVETVAIPAAGGFQRDTHVPIGYVEVRNLGASEVTVVTGGLASSAPKVGVGVSVVPAGQVQKINLAASTFAVYGTAGERVCLQAFSVGTEA